MVLEDAMDSIVSSTDGGPSVAAVEAALAFARTSDVSTDSRRPGALRAASIPAGMDPHAALDFRLCRIHDFDAPDGVQPSLDVMGFETIDLSQLDPLQRVLERVRVAGTMTRADVSEIRRRLWGHAFRLADGQRLRIVFIASEGTILRKSGPNGTKADPDEPMTEMNGHDAALSVHGDQDVRGTPVRQLLRGLGPWLFRHASPDGENRRSPLRLVNVWIPLQQVTRPLALMDQRSLDRRRHQARYALPTDGFLDRDESMRVNDIWTYLHDEGQRWYFGSHMDTGRAYVFDTLSTPHGAFVLPGEERAEQLRRRLQSAREASARNDVQALSACTVAVPGSLPTATTAPLRRAVETMEELLLEAHRHPDAVAGKNGEPFRRHAAEAMDRVVRKSIEMRTVALITPF